MRHVRSASPTWKEPKMLMQGEESLGQHWTHLYGRLGISVSQRDILPFQTTLCIDCLSYWERNRFIDTGDPCYAFDRLGPRPLIAELPANLDSSLRDKVVHPEKTQT